MLTVIIQRTKKLGYTALMGVPPKVQPSFADINQTANKNLGYTTLMGVPPKVQPTFADINQTATKTWVTLHSWVCHLKCSLRLLTVIIQRTKKLGYTALMGVPPKVQPMFADSKHTADKKTGLHCTHECAT